MVNTKHDTSSYESRSYQREIFDGNALYDAYVKAKQGSDWKPDVQKFEMFYLLGLANMHDHIENKTYEFMPTSSFILNERGTARHITGEQIPDRIVKHALCDEILNPTLAKYLIHDNGASIKGKGIDFSRQRLVTHLRKYYAQHGSNKGYILLVDFSKYYDNIRHDILMELFQKYITNDYALWLLQKTLERERVDVSFMDEDQYEDCMNAIFNSLSYQQIDSSLLTGEKFMSKHLNIGDQVAQTAGVAYPIRYDNYAKIVKGVKFYGRYMDDSYAIHESKNFLEELEGELIEIASDLGITVNTHKTRICKLDEQWRYLQIQYALTDTGRVIQKIHPKRLTTMRRKMKKLAPTMRGIDFYNWYHSWFKSQYRIMSKQQRINMDTLYKELKEVTLWSTK